MDLRMNDVFQLTSTIVWISRLVVELNPDQSILQTCSSSYLSTLIFEEDEDEDEEANTA